MKSNVFGYKITSRFIWTENKCVLNFSIHLFSWTILRRCGHRSPYFCCNCRSWCHSRLTGSFYTPSPLLEVLLPTYKAIEHLAQAGWREAFLFTGRARKRFRLPSEFSRQSWAGCDRRSAHATSSSHALELDVGRGPIQPRIPIHLSKIWSIASLQRYYQRWYIHFFNAPLKNSSL